jgi:hypothetical protein
MWYHHWRPVYDSFLRLNSKIRHPALVGMRGERPFEHRIETLAARRDRHALEALAAQQIGRAGAEERVVRRLDARQWKRGLEHAPVGVGVDQERTELVPEPERPVRRPAKRLDVEVAAREQLAAADQRIDRHRAGGVRVARHVRDDREVDLSIRVTERESRPQLDPAGAAGLGMEVWIDLVKAQQGVGRVRLGPEAVVLHQQEAAVTGAQHRGNALHGLGVEKRRRAAVRRGDELPGRRTGSEAVGGELREGHELLRLGAATRAGQARASAEAPDRTPPAMPSTSLASLAPPSVRALA